MSICHDLGATHLDWSWVDHSILRGSCDLLDCVLGLADKNFLLQKLHENTLFEPGFNWESESPVVAVGDSCLPRLRFNHAAKLSSPAWWLTPFAPVFDPPVWSSSACWRNILTFYEFRDGLFFFFGMNSEMDLIEALRDGVVWPYIGEDD